MIQRKVIYEASQKKFFEDVVDKKVADIMKANFEDVSFCHVSESEYSSWDSTADEIKRIIERSELKDLHLCFEYQVPYGQGRIDCILFGQNSKGKGVAVHIEMKRWQSVVPLEEEGNFVETYISGTNRKLPHPSQQVEGYHNYLINFVEVFEEDLNLEGYAYCHNYKKKEGEGLFSPQYNKIIEKHPLYTKDDIVRFAEKLKLLLSQGNGFEIFNKFMLSPVKPSKKLIEHISNIVEENKKEFSLINDQIVAKNSIMHKIKKAEKENEKNVVIVKGGPGTGKTVIALNILAELASQKKKRKLFFSTKSKPLREAIRKKVGKDAKLLFTNLTQFTPSKTGEDELDVLIIDEAHRIEKTSNNIYTRREDRTDMPQVDQLVRAAKTSIFFIDDLQRIRGQEVGSVKLIREAAKKYNCSLVEEELVSQFRCGGSDDYLAWLEAVLGHTKQKEILTKQKEFEFKIFDSPKELYKSIKEKDDAEGTSARLTAGFCWLWSNKLDENGQLVKDVKIGSFAMPWETHMSVNPPKGYVRWYEWAYKPEGIKQVGCIYTAQGFEFDYIGVIIGPDLRYDKENDRLVGDISKTKDPMLKRGKEDFDEYVRNIYRVLMSRGLKGCYVYFVDKEVEKFFKSRIRK